MRPLVVMRPGMIDSGVLLINRPNKAIVRLKTCQRRERVKTTIMEQYLNTYWSKKSGRCFHVLVVHRWSILFHDNFDVSNNVFEEDIGNTGAMHF
jgi:hypothetical protein